MIISSLGNERVKAIRKLQDRKVRAESGLFFIEGLRIVAEAIEQRAKIDTLVVAPDLLISEFGQRLLEEQRMRGVRVWKPARRYFAAFP